jgi:protein ImuB
VFHAEPFIESQIDLAGEAAGEAGLAALADRLAARLGASRITRFLPVDTHVPERAVTTRPLAERDGAGPGGRQPAATDGMRANAAWRDWPEAEDETPPVRPLRLFTRPERVDVLAEVPEGPPLRFRWRRALVEVARAEGPERIAPEWWRAEDFGRATRDYYRVEDAEGRRYWLFREGLYERETASPVWFLHGLFA